MSFPTVGLVILAEPKSFYLSFWLVQNPFQERFRTSRNDTAKKSVKNWILRYTKSYIIKTMKYGKKAITKAALEKWPNPHPDRDYNIEINFP